MSRVWILLALVAMAVIFPYPTNAADSLHTADTVFVIPAGPVAGSFTPSARITVADTIAGWARIQIEGWVPVGAVMDRLQAAPNPFEAANASVDQSAKKKAEVRQCEGVTRKGTRCTRNAQKGSRYCWQHLPR